MFCVSGEEKTCERTGERGIRSAEIHRRRYGVIQQDLSKFTSGVSSPFMYSGEELK
jgi:hypothetical protein